MFRELLLETMLHDRIITSLLILTRPIIVFQSYDERRNTLGLVNTYRNTEYRRRNLLFGLVVVVSLLIVLASLYKHTLSPYPWWVYPVYLSEVFLAVSDLPPGESKVKQMLRSISRAFTPQTAQEA